MNDIQRSYLHRYCSIVLFLSTKSVRQRRIAERAPPRRTLTSSSFYRQISPLHFHHPHPHHYKPSPPSPFPYPLKAINMSPNQIVKACPFCYSGDLTQYRCGSRRRVKCRYCNSEYDPREVARLDLESVHSRRTRWMKENPGYVKMRNASRFTR